MFSRAAINQRQTKPCESLAPPTRGQMRDRLRYLQTKYDKAHSEEKHLRKENVALSNRNLEQDRLLLNDNNKVAELEVIYKLEQDHLVQTNNNRVAELHANLHEMTHKYNKERGMFDVIRKSKNTDISNLKKEHNDEIVKMKEEHDTIYLNLEKEKTIIHAFQYIVQAVHLEELKTRDKAMRDKENQLRVVKLYVTELREKNKREKNK